MTNISTSRLTYTYTRRRTAFDELHLVVIIADLLHPEFVWIAVCSAARLLAKLEIHVCQATSAGHFSRKLMATFIICGIYCNKIQVCVTRTAVRAYLRVLQPSYLGIGRTITSPE